MRLRSPAKLSDVRPMQSQYLADIFYAELPAAFDLRPGHIFLMLRAKMLFCAIERLGNFVLERTHHFADHKIVKIARQAHESTEPGKRIRRVLSRLYQSSDAASG